MIKYVTILAGTTVDVRWDSGKTATYMLKNIPNTVMNFILREDVKAYDNGWSVLYKINK